MAVRYILRKPDPPRADEPQDIIGRAGLVNESVTLTAPEGIEAGQVVEEITTIASLSVPFEDSRVRRFCERYQVTEENDAKKRLRNLLNFLKWSRLVLQNHDGELDVDPPAPHE